MALQACADTLYRVLRPHGAGRLRRLPGPADCGVPVSALLTLAETSERLHLHVNTTRLLLAHGLPHIRLGRAIRIDPAALDEWLARRTVVTDGCVRRGEPVPENLRRPVDRASAGWSRRAPLCHRDGPRDGGASACEAPTGPGAVLDFPASRRRSRRRVPRSMAR